MLPVVSLTSADAPRHIDDACVEFGFFAIVDHGIPDAVLDDLWASARGFFDLPEHVKRAVAFPYAGYPYGYAPFEYERLGSSIGTVTPPDVKESLAIGPVDPPQHTFADPAEAIVWSPNRWPADPPDLRRAWSVAYREFAALSERILSLMARGLGLPETWFEPLVDRHTSAMRALDYPCVNRTLEHGQQRAGAHTDYGTLTVLVADPRVGGLEVQRRDGSWLAVPPPPWGTLIVNLGDAMARWTNDRWRSTMHRVVPADQRRQSVAFFHNANWDASIECLPTCRADDEPPRYEPMAAGPHLMAKFTSTVAGG